MAEKPAALTVKRSVNRPSSAQFETLENLPIGNIVDSQGRTGALSYKIKPITTAFRILGPALTIDAGPRDNLAAWMALEHAREGDVLMIATGGYELSSVIGDLFVGMARNIGVSGIVTDGVVRDLEGLEAIGIPVFALGISSNSPQKNGPGTIGLPIVIGGVSVSSGDIICGDRDGVVVVEQHKLPSVISDLKEVTEKESAVEKAITSGATIPGWIAEAKSTLKINYLD